MVLLLVRHAHAGDRDKWVGDDSQRPLTPKGQRQATGLAALLAPFAIDRIMSSPYARCMQTVEPLAESLGLRVDAAEALGEGHRAAGLALVDLDSDDVVVLCGHGDTVPYMLLALTGRGAFDDMRCEKASTWVVRTATEITLEYLPPPSSGGGEGAKSLV